MSSLNKATLIGRIGKDPETKIFSSGNSILIFTLATSKNYKDSNGEKQTITTWHKITISNPSIIKNLSSYLKGLLIYLEGEIRHQEYEDKETKQKKFITDILVGYDGVIKFLETNKEKSETSEPKSDEKNFSDDEIPF